MKLVRYGAKGKELPGIIDNDGKLRSLAGLVNEKSEQFLSDKGLTELGRMILANFHWFLVSLGLVVPLPMSASLSRLA